jgi:geranylgeranyl pyrophosphate synthase
MNLNDILEPIESDLARVEAELESQIAHIRDQAFGAEVSEPVDYFFGVPGKRLRPALALLAARALGAKGRASADDGAALADSAGQAGDALVKVATATELIHSASLVHDDVIDREQTRRGRRALNVAYGNTIAVLVGDLYYAQFFSILKDLVGVGSEKQKRLFDIFLATTRKMCVGEIYEARLLRAGRKPTLSDYLRIVEYKTASLMSAACEAAAVVVDAPGHRRRTLADFGLSIGMAYQLVDDAVDRDATFGDREAILERAGEAGRRARTALEGLARGPAARLLDAMVTYVAARVGRLEVRTTSA